MAETTEAPQELTEEVASGTIIDSAVGQPGVEPGYNQVTLDYLASQPLVEVNLDRRVFVDGTARAFINGVEIRVQTGIPTKIPAPFAELFMARQNGDLAAEEHRARLARGGA